MLKSANYKKGILRQGEFAQSKAQGQIQNKKAKTPKNKGEFKNKTPKKDKKSNF